MLKETTGQKQQTNVHEPYTGIILLPEYIAPCDTIHGDVLLCLREPLPREVIDLTDDPMAIKTECVPLSVNDYCHFEDTHPCLCIKQYGRTLCFFMDRSSLAVCGAPPSASPGWYVYTERESPNGRYLVSERHIVDRMKRLVFNSANHMQMAWIGCQEWKCKCGTDEQPDWCGTQSKWRFARDDPRQQILMHMVSFKYGYNVWDRSQTWRDQATMLANKHGAEVLVDTCAWILTWDNSDGVSDMAQLILSSWLSYGCFADRFAYPFAQLDMYYSPLECHRGGDWAKICVLIAFMRANRTSPIRYSILPLVPLIISSERNKTPSMITYEHCFSSGVHQYRNHARDEKKKTGKKHSYDDPVVVRKP